MDKWYNDRKKRDLRVCLSHIIKQEGVIPSFDYFKDRSWDTYIRIKKMYKHEQDMFMDLGLERLINSSYIKKKRFTPLSFLPSYSRKSGSKN